MEQTTPLLKLAPELRNKIWTFAVVNDQPINVSYLTSPDEPALLATCKQIREEASGIYYGNNTFVTCDRSTFYYGKHEPFDWAAAIGETKCEWINHLRVIVHEDLQDYWEGWDGFQSGVHWIPGKDEGPIYERYLEKRILHRILEAIELGLWEDCVTFVAAEPYNDTTKDHAEVFQKAYDQAMRDLKATSALSRGELKAWFSERFDEF